MPGRKRSAEQKRKAHAEVQRKRRQNPENLEKDRLQKKRRRETTERTEEQSYDTERRRSRRLAEGFKAQEQEQDAARHRELRLDPDYRSKEKEKDAAHHSQLRLDPEYSAEEHGRNAAEHRKRREDPDVRREEQKKDTQRKKQEREDSKKRAAYNEKQRKLMAKRSSVSFETLLAKFHASIRETPVYICSCCGGLFYKAGTVEVKEGTFKKKKFDKFFVKSVLHVDQQMHRLCKTCHRSALANKIPKLALVNGLELPVVPEPLQVSCFYPH